MGAGRYRGNLSLESTITTNRSRLCPIGYTTRINSGGLDPQGQEDAWVIYQDTLTRGQFIKDGLRLLCIKEQWRV